jgi:hypothetical protein
MKRAIVWICWGETFLAEAVESARTTLAIDADRFLITDEAGVRQAQQSTEFTALVAMNPVYGNNLEKTRLIEFLPGGYDVYLFLDADTRVLGEVMLGFDKAARHGMAMVPDPQYNLTSNFGHVMEQCGVKPADQTCYNSGVIYFQLTPSVRQVLERWRDLAPMGMPNNFARDQPFLILAMEQLGFVPYALSPLYNYRSVAEPAIGSIRIWHSHFPPPADVNEAKPLYPVRRYPLRRFKNGVRLPPDAKLFDTSKSMK